MHNRHAYRVAQRGTAWLWQVDCAARQGCCAVQRPVLQRSWRPMPFAGSCASCQTLCIRCRLKSWLQTTGFVSVMTRAPGAKPENRNSGCMKYKPAIVKWHFYVLCLVCMLLCLVCMYALIHCLHVTWWSSTNINSTWHIRITLWHNITYWQLLTDTTHENINKYSIDWQVLATFRQWMCSSVVLLMALACTSTCDC